MKVGPGVRAMDTPGVGPLPAGTPIPELPYTSPPSVADTLVSLGRTEDVAFSSSGRRLAVAALARNRIAVFDVGIASSRGDPPIVLTGGLELSSRALQQPHGVGFVDDDTLIVTSRESGVALFALPPGERDVRAHDVLPMARWPSDGATLFNVPGSVSVVRADGGECEILVCNNGGDTVTRHRLERHPGWVIRHSDVVLQRYLEIPDGVSVSRDRRWIAVSNHNTHSVLLYENSPALNAETAPDGVLRRVYYPHGLAFSVDGRYLFVADAGAPCLHIYARDPDEWRGVRHPVATVRLMTDAIFWRGRHSPAQGGPKGLDVDAGSQVVVVTSECQPLAFFGMRALLQHASAGCSAPEQRLLDTTYELTLLHERHQMTRRVREVIDGFQNSRSWRITAPLRHLTASWRRRRALR
jgi:hypothetical protein